MFLNDNKRFSTFDEVVRLICAYLKDSNASKHYVDVSRFLALILEEFSLNVIPSIKSVALIINDNLTVDLPDDVMEVTKVGVCCGGREIKILGRNTKLCKTAFKNPAPIECCTCNKEEGTSSTEEEGSCCSACTFNNFTSTRSRGLGLFGPESGHYLYGHSGYLYGYMPRNSFIEGTYDVDEANNRLLLGDGGSVCPGKELVVEYSAVLEGDGFRLIPRKARMALMYRVAFMINNHQSDWKQFQIHYRELKRSYDNFALEDWVNAVRGSYASSPKR